MKMMFFEMMLNAAAALAVSLVLIGVMAGVKRICESILNSRVSF